MAIPPEKSGQPKLSLQTIAVSPQIHLLILDGPPQSLDKNVAKTPSPARPAQLAVICAAPPITWATCMMSQCIDCDSLFVRAIDKCEGKSPEKHTSRSILR